MKEDVINVKMPYVIRYWLMKRFKRYDSFEKESDNREVLEKMMCENTYIEVYAEVRIEERIEKGWYRATVSGSGDTEEQAIEDLKKNLAEWRFHNKRYYI